MKKIYFMLILLISNAYTEDVFAKDYSIYFLGLVKHLEPTSKTHEGDMGYLAISKWKDYDSFSLEGGLGTYKDSYNLRAYMLYINLANDTFSYGVLKPMIGAMLQSKGVKYNSNKRKVILTPSLKLRVGQNDGLFMNIMAVPKIGKLTNGLYSVEFGYKI